MKCLRSNSGSTSTVCNSKHRPVHNYQIWYLHHKWVWRHLPMCFAGPVRVLLLQSTEQVQGLWLLLLQLRHWFQEGSRAEEHLQLSVGIKEGERKIFTWGMHHKDQFQGKGQCSTNSSCSHSHPKCQKFSTAGTANVISQGCSQRPRHPPSAPPQSGHSLYFCSYISPHYAQ